jgi:hypothetical protein
MDPFNDTQYPYPSTGYSGRLKRLFSNWYLVSLLASLFLVSALLFMVRHSGGFTQMPDYKLNEIADQTVRVPKAITIIDKEQSQAKKNAILDTVTTPYVYEQESVDTWKNLWKVSVQRTRQRKDLNAREKNNFFGFSLNVDLDSSERRVLAKLAYSKSLENSIDSSFRVINNLKIIEEKKRLKKGIELQNKDNSYDKLKGRFVPGVVDVEEAQDAFTRQSSIARGSWRSWDLYTKRILLNLQSKLIKANVRIEENENKKRNAEALKDYEPVVEEYSRGQVIVREGERVSSRHLLVLEKLKEHYKGELKLKGLLFEALFGAFCLWMCLIYIKHVYPATFEKRKNTWVATFLILCALASFKLLLIFQFEVIAEQFPRLPLSFFLFFIPVAAPVMISRLLFSSSISVLFTILYGFGAGLLLGQAALFGLYIVCMGLCSVMFMKDAKTRSELYRAGFYTACFCGISAALLVMAWGGGLPTNAAIVQNIDSGIGSWLGNVLWSSLGGFIGGWLSSVLALVFTPLFENVFGYTTDLKLLELGRSDHPLLRELVLKAPGTYHHSLLVGSLTEAGSKAVGGNALLGRVGAMYHDIGKMERSDYFMENISDKNNSPHKVMSPQQSARVIISHVTKGVVLAKRHNLGKAIVDFILQHHGSSVAGYFYYQAKKEAEAKGGKEAAEKIRKEDFQYPGPNPQTKEAAVMALADSCEAATRALPDPTPERVKAKVDSIFMDAFESGLLEDAPISLKDLHRISAVFKNILLAVHHSRVQYPEDREKDKEREDKKRSA